MSRRKKKSPLKSFQDLRRLLDPDAAREEPDEQPLETRQAPGESFLHAGDAGARAIIAAAGDAFGPMAAGPPPYRDIHSEEMELLASFRVRTVFPDAVAREAAKLPPDPVPADLQGRADLRGERIFTIDGDDAKDFDDAVQIKALPDGGVELVVHIADVSHYVTPGTTLDHEALTRGTSIYLPDQVIPMLPESLSNRLCSLMPDRDRLVFSASMTFDREGRRTGYGIQKGVIRSIRRCTYRVVQDLLDGKETEETRALEPIAGDLRLLQTWTRRQQLLRDRRGSLRMQSSVPHFLFDEQHEVRGIVPSALYFSQTLIEETALAANQAVGDFFRKRGLPTIYRVHPEKDPEEVEAVSKMLAEFGIRVPAKERLTGRDVGRLIREARRRPNSEALIGRIMGLVERAVYEVADHEDRAQHWGLAREHYLHFTSPIRRYPDLIVHRWLHDVLSRGAEAQDELVQPEQVAELVEIAGHCSLQSELADMVQRAVEDLKVCQYMEHFEGQVLPARIQRVSPAGLEIFLEKEHVKGFIHGRTLEGRKRVEGATYHVISRRGHRAFREGDALKVRVAHIDFVRLQVLLELAA